MYTMYTCILGEPPQLTRKHVSDMYYIGELESEAREPTHPHRILEWTFTSDSDRDKYMQLVVAEQSTKKYAHTPSETCKARG